MKAAAAHYPIIQEEVDEMIAKGVLEPSSGCTSFYSNVFVVPKHIGGLWPILNFKQFHHYLHIPSYKMFAIRYVWQLIQHDNYAFSIDLQDAYIHFPIVKHHCCFYGLFGAICDISGRFYLLGLAQPLGFHIPP